MPDRFRMAGDNLLCDRYILFLNGKSHSHASAAVSPQGNVPGSGADPEAQEAASDTTRYTGGDKGTIMVKWNVCCPTPKT